MDAVRFRLNLLACLALLAMFGVAFGPSVSRVIGPVAVTAAGMHEHSMAMGAHSHMGEGGPAQPSEHAHGTEDSSCPLDCCDLCAVAAAPCLGVAAFLPQWLAVQRVPPPRVALSSARPDVRQVWSNAAPRGPPQFF